MKRSPLALLMLFLFPGCLVFSGALTHNGGECGDGIALEGEEECDDGNQSDNDTCKSDCTFNTCGDGALFVGDEECDDGNNTVGDGCSDLCRLESCGNGRLEAGEECDDGNVSNADGCSTVCVLAFCGDGLIELGQEECDDQNTVPGDGCDSNCRGESCGNGVLDVGEQCDDGNSSNTDDCTGACEDALCGDGLLRGNSASPEECDDANLANGDGCSQACRLEVCGNGVLDFGEQCDDADGDNSDNCTIFCRLASCGDGFLRKDLSGDDEECDDGDQTAGDGCNAQCRLEVCGNGALDVGEQCDDANLDNNDFCNSQCLQAFCGDGLVQIGVEECDDQNLASGDGCSSTCFSELCGNAVIDAGEGCDDGNQNNNDGCTNACLSAFCGDGVTNFSTEQCDDGNLTSGDGCSSICLSEICGNGVVDFGEVCDDGNQNNTDLCTNACLSASCGDGIRQSTEQCDDGNIAAGDGCNAVCLSEICGNGVVDFSEQCDDANGNNNDACTNTCRSAICGDGVTRLGVEECDDGNQTAGDGCFFCQAEVCGNGRLDFGEQCDDDNTNQNDACTNFCLNATCGDGIQRAGVEECDDLNNTSGDGCSSLCQSEICGNGRLDFGEQCDDANSNNNDACTNNCLTAFCGDGITRTGIEECDDANPLNGDGCSPLCQAEVCGNGRLDFGEQCDDFNTINEDSCLSICRVSSCGDGFVLDLNGDGELDAGDEACDDANDTNTDDCTALCQVAVCGDGILKDSNDDGTIDPGDERCDDGNLVSGDGCDSDCTPTSCGNGIVTQGEECDDQNNLDIDTCTNSCLLAVCGDGIVKDLNHNGVLEIELNDELCDDGNLVNGDGCDDCFPTSVVDFAAGGSHTCVLTSNGDVRCWGLSDAGQLGYGNTNNIGDNETPASAGNVPLGISALSIVAGAEHTCVRLEDGRARCWGNGAQGRLGTGNVASIGAVNTPTRDARIQDEATQIALGDAHTCVLLSGGKVRCWGEGSFGRLGYESQEDIGDNDDVAQFGDINLGGNVTQIAIGAEHSCALLSGGIVRCWGRNQVGQLGYGNTVSIGDDPGEMPPANVNVGGTVTQLFAGGNRTCAVLSTGAVRCWGDGIFGSLGYGNTNNIGDNETPSSAGDVNVGGTVTRLAMGLVHTCALLTTGNIRCWGNGAFGRLGYGNITTIGDNETPASAGDVNVGGTVSQIKAGARHTCAILTTGDVRCWGQAEGGKLGYGTLFDMGDNETPAAVGSLALGFVAVDLSLGELHTCAKTNTGHLRCWGSGAFGRLGYGDEDNLGDDEPAGFANDIDLGAAVLAFGAGKQHTCASLNDGTLKCWGDGASGRLGYGNQNDLGDNEVPASLPGVRMADEVLILAAGKTHTCALLGGVSGPVRCWGDGASGRLGYGSTNAVGDNELPSAFGSVSIGGVVNQIVTGDDHTCVVLDDSTVRCWGEGDSGRLGYGNTNDIGDNEAPATAGTVNLGAEVAFVVAGGRHNCAVLSTGELRCWGENSAGQLGYGHTQNIGDNAGEMPPPNVNLGGELVLNVALGDDFTCALLRNGDVLCWGANQSGQLGYGHTQNIGDNAGEMPPLVLNLGDSPISLTAGDRHICARFQGHDVRCWGEGSFGRLGYGNQNDLGDTPGEMPAPIIAIF